MISMFLTTFLDDINFLGFCLLPFVLPSSGRKENKPLQTVERARHVRLDLRTPLMPFKQYS
jgi:hypothetical protein